MGASRVAEMHVLELDVPFDFFDGLALLGPHIDLWHAVNQVLDLGCCPLRFGHVGGKGKDLASRLGTEQHNDK